VTQINTPIEFYNGFAAIPHGMKPTCIQTTGGQTTATVFGWTAKGEYDARYYDLYELSYAHKTEFVVNDIPYLVYTGLPPYTREGFRYRAQVVMSIRPRVFGGNDENSEAISSYRAEMAAWKRNYSRR
jgi:hypothetical protein